MSADNKTFLEDKIKTMLNEMSSLFFQIQQRRQVSDFEDIDDDDHEFEITTSDMTDDFGDMVKQVYRFIFHYIETTKMPEYLKYTEKILGGLIDDGKYFHEHNNTPEEFAPSLFVYECWSLLRVYPAFHDQDLKYLLKRTGLIYLENILSNTGVIIHNNNINIKGEPDVYNAVKVVCKATFPDAQEVQSAFVKTAKEFKPDILVPSLNCAIEYKYAEDETKLKATIEGVVADVKNYSNHPYYKIFYAVFYVTRDIWGQKKFDEVWKEFEFPANWKGIYVVG